MDTFLKRNYAPTGKADNQGQKKNYPFWDYRSRRGNESTNNSTSSGISSCSSSEAGAKKVMLCASIREEWSDRPVAVCSDTDTVDTSFSDMTSLTASLPATNPPQPMMSLLFLSPSENPDELVNLYKPFLGWIDPNIGIFECVDNDDVMGDILEPVRLGSTLEMPSLAIIIFLQEEEMIGNDRLSKAKRYFERPPWKFHHSEWVSAYHIQAYEYNSHDYFLPSEDLPLCSVRQIHCGGEHVRIVRFVTSHNWQDTINLYKLLLGQDPEFVKLDFCVFTLESHVHYDVQFALKKLPRGVVPSQTRRTALNIRVPDVASLAPLLPITCSHVAGARWSTRDLDGNQVFLEVAQVRTKNGTRHLSRLREVESIHRLSPRVGPPAEEPKSSSDVSCKSPKTEHRKRRTRTRPKQAKSKFSYSGPGSSFRPITKSLHQRTDSGFIEGVRHDVLTDIAIDAMKKLGEKGSLFMKNSVPDSPPDSPWESQSSASNSDYLGPFEFHAPQSHIDHRQKGHSVTSSEESSPKQESGYFEGVDHSDLESIREYAIDCGDLVANKTERKRSCDLSPNQQTQEDPNRETGPNQQYTSSYSLHLFETTQSFPRTLNSISSSNNHSKDADQSYTNSAEIPQDKVDCEDNTKESVDSFLESLKQREIRHNYPSRGIGAHGTLSANTQENCDMVQPVVAGQNMDERPLPDRLKTPPPLAPKPKVVLAASTTSTLWTYGQEARVNNREGGCTTSRNVFSKPKVQKRVTFKEIPEDCELDEPKGESQDSATPGNGQTEQLGFWI